MGWSQRYSDKVFNAAKVFLLAPLLVLVDSRFLGLEIS